MGILAWRLRSLFRGPPDGSDVEASDATQDFLPPDTEPKSDPEWDELLSWAQVTPDSGVVALTTRTAERTPAPAPALHAPIEPRPSLDETPTPPPEVKLPPVTPSEADEWAAVIARVKALHPVTASRAGDQPLRPLRPVKTPLWASPVAARLERLVATKTRIDQEEAAAAQAAAEEDEWRTLIARAKVPKTAGNA
jgi:hypothetical protein